MSRSFRILTTCAVIFTVFFSAVMPFGFCYCAGCACENSISKNVSRQENETKSCCSGSSCCSKTKNHSQKIEKDSQKLSDVSPCCQNSLNKNQCGCGSSGENCRCGKLQKIVISLPDISSPVKKIQNNNHDFFGIVIFSDGFNAVYHHLAASNFFNHSPPETSHVALHVLFCVFII